MNRDRFVAHVFIEALYLSSNLVPTFFIENVSRALS